MPGPLGAPHSPVQAKPRSSLDFPALLDRHRRALAFALVLIGSVRIAATYTVFNHTFDEPATVASGMEWLDKGVYHWEHQHPPLARIAAALGPYLSGIRSQNTPDRDGLSKSFEGVAILYSGHHYDRTLALARLGILPFFWVACWVVFEWGRRYYSGAVAVAALFLFSFLPPILAHSGLATLDMALTAFTGAAFLTGMIWLERPTRGHALWFGAATGLMVLSKLSCLLFFPVAAGAVLVCYCLAERPGGARWAPQLAGQAKIRLLSLALAVLTACLVIWAGYRFSFGDAGFLHLKLPAPELYSGIRAVLAHNAEGATAYLLGERSQNGFWCFFLVALAVKTPIAFLVLLAFGSALALPRQGPSPRLWIPLVFGAAILVAASTGHINIGLRYILPVYIGFSIVAGAAAIRLVELATAPSRGAHWSRLRSEPNASEPSPGGAPGGAPLASGRRWLLAAPVLLACWLAVSSLASHPDYLPYFNEFAGSRPEEIIADSDLDWGQDVKRLATALQRAGARRVVFANQMIGDLEHQHGLPPGPKVMDALNPAPGWNAVSITFLKQRRLGLLNHPELTPWPERIPPMARIGKGILLWYFPEDRR